MTRNYISLLISFFINFSWGQDRNNALIVVLHNFHLKTNISASSFLDAHINYLKVAYPEVEITKVFSNLQRFDFVGYSAFAPEPAQAAIKSDPRVKYAEKVALFHTASMIQYIPFDASKSLNLIRADKNLPINPTGECTIEYSVIDKYVGEEQPYNSYGQGVDVYVLDTGIYSEHMLFEGRAIWGYDAISPENPLKTDNNGHGTAIAGMIGGSKVGIAQAVSLIDVRVLDEAGEGSTADIISGIDFIAGQILASTDSSLHQQSQMMMNLGFTGPISLVLNEAVDIIAQEIVVVTAAGDQDRYSCHTSPGSAKQVVNVAATSRRNDLPILNSNYGSNCIHMNAPGEDLTTTWPADFSATTKMTGSSLAAAVVSGFGAVILGQSLHSDLDTLSSIDRISANLIRTLLRMSKDSSNPLKSPHVLPWKECQSTDITTIIPNIKRLIREILNSMITTTSLESIKKGVADLANNFERAKESKSESKPSQNSKKEEPPPADPNLGQRWNKKKIVDTSPKTPKFKTRPDEKIEKKEQPIKNSPPPPVEKSVKQNVPPKKKTQAEIIAESKRLRKLKKYKQ